MEQKFVVIKTANSYKKVFIKDIIYCSASGSYTKISTFEEVYCDSKLLKEYEKKLNNYDFIRLSRSELVNMAYCAEINIGRSPFLLLTNDKKIEISARRLSKVIKTFKTLQG